jgi:LmbE family N-acetylglucosaminyl deacetylase
MLTDRERLARQRAQPALLRLHTALSRLTSTLTVMNTGAHPDDEESGMLAALRFGYGMRIVIACSTRGEGGQNSLGPERTGALGVVRSRELEEAARVLDADIAWLGHGPADAVHDFGFSKNGVDTLARWGKERIIERLVRAYRAERPDIVIPTFLDVPGQHGHHRAMTEAAETAIGLAADPSAYPEQFEDGLSPWQVAKYYLPAWSGGGGTYDDEVPPPDGTVIVSAPGRDFATGAAFADIGEWSRAYHASQGMGFWSAEPQTIWPLHLKLGAAGGETTIADGLLADLRQLGDLVSRPAAPHLCTAQDAIDAALRAFPDREAITAALLTAADALDAAEALLTPADYDLVAHRIERKRREVDIALLVAAGIGGTAWARPNTVSPGGTTTLHVHLEDGAKFPTVVTPIADDGVEAGAPVFANGITRFEIAVADDAQYSNPYAPDFSSLGGNGALCVQVETTIGDRSISMLLDLEEPLQIVPRQSVELKPNSVILRRFQPHEAFPVELRVEGAKGTPTIASGAEFSIALNGSTSWVTPKSALPNGLYRLPVRIDGEMAYKQTEIDYPHIGATRFIAPQTLDILALDLALPENARIGYVAGGSDSVGLWLARMGLDVTELDATALRGDLSGYTSIVIGIFAFGLRPDLAAAAPRIHDWVKAGGHLLTLYHRPSDGWDPEATPPARLVIGSPSLRWRVTNPIADVEILAPDHPLLTGPNRIGIDDWSGWDKERGLYFASDWESVYVPLLSMHDSNEQPLKGALLSAPLGKGRHTHTSLVLHHQLDHLVPGAFRLIANLVQPVR